MSHIPESWFAPVDSYNGMGHLEAMQWILEWYKQEQVNVLGHLGQCKQKIKDREIDYDVNTIDLHDPMSRLREGCGTQEDWDAYDKLRNKMIENICDIQDELQTIKLLRHRLTILKNQIDNAQDDVADAKASAADESKSQ